MKKANTDSGSDKPLPQMNLEELKAVLKKRGDNKPSYIFAAVERSTESLEYGYVFWLDLMGARNAMKISLPQAARSIMKIHAAALLAKERHPEMEINPVMDGVYGYVGDRKALETCLTEILASLANVFVHEKTASSRFMVRAGVAFGPLISGSALAEGAPILKQNVSYLGSTAIGMAISHAYEAESSAPPFGVYIHESARAFAPTDGKSGPYLVNLWRWFAYNDPLTWALRRTLLEHFGWLEKNPVSAQYDPEARRRHYALAEEYFKLHAVLPLPEDAE
jgi:hypothetical protein